MFNVEIFVFLMWYKLVIWTVVVRILMEKQGYGYLIRFLCSSIFRFNIPKIKKGGLLQSSKSINSFTKYGYSLNIHE